MHWTAEYKSETGTKHAENEDSVTLRPDLGVFAVADGMGGYKGGALASRAAVEAVTEYWESTLAEGLPRDSWPNLLSEGIQAANYVIHEHSLKNPQLIGMGTTLTVLGLRANQAFIGHVGDSRCYHFRDGNISQVTRDHSVNRGTVPGAMVLSRAVGLDQELVVDNYEIPVESFDLLLLCSDGISCVLELNEIKNILAKNIAQICSAAGQSEGRSISPELCRIVSDLVRLARIRGSNDDATAIIVAVQ